MILLELLRKQTFQIGLSEEVNVVLCQHVIIGKPYIFELTELSAIRDGDEHVFPCHSTDFRQHFFRFVNMLQNLKKKDSIK
jgi:hypothetical protein